jgi:hypothetical protein
VASSSDEIGKIGQKKFSLLCSDASVVCNKSDEDERGWDFFIQYPETRQPEKPLDLRKAARSALVQVKTTRSADRTVQLSLSNALRMAESREPFFIILVRLAAEEQQEAFFVRHVWREEIEKTLRAVRQADSEGDDALYLRTISFTLDESEATADPLATITARIDEIGGLYAEAKKKLFDTVGFEDGYGTAEIILEVESADDVLDLQIGLRDSLAFTRIVYRSNRFGIDSGKPEIDRTDGRLFVDPAPRHGTLRLCSSAGEEIFTPALVTGVVLPGGDPLMRKSRIVASCVELIILGSGKTQAKAHLATSAPALLQTIELFGQLVQWRGTGPISLTLHMDGESKSVGAIDLDNDLGVDLGWIDIGKAAGILKKVAATAMLNAIEISPLEINDARADLQLMTYLVGPHRHHMSFPKQTAFDRPWKALLSSLAIKVGGWSFGVVVQWPVVHDTEIDSTRQLTFDPPRILAAEASSASDVDEKITRRRDEIVARMPDTVLNVGDFSEYYRRATSRTADDSTS